VGKYVRGRSDLGGCSSDDVHISSFPSLKYGFKGRSSVRLAFICSYWHCPTRREPTVVIIYYRFGLHPTALAVIVFLY
jgi:hypothetical protein